MTKKPTKKKSEHHAVVEHHTQEPPLNKVMLENFVSLQKVMTNLSLKLDGLTTQISKLLELFEISAKALAEKDFEIESDSKEMTNKLNSLLDQNKILARGLSLMHERIPRDQQPIPVQQTYQPPAMQLSPYMREMPQNTQSPQFQNTRPIRPLSQEISDSQPNFQKPRFESPGE